MSGIEAWKSSSAYFYIDTYFYLPNIIKVANCASNPMNFGSLRVIFILVNYIATSSSGTNYQLPYLKDFSSVTPSPTYLGTSSSWFDTTHIICGVKFTQFTNNFYEYTSSISGDSVFYQSTLTPGPTYPFATYSYCLIAASKLCPSTHPFYDSNTNLCYVSCAGQSTNDYFCCSFGSYRNSANQCVCFQG